VDAVGATREVVGPPPPAAVADPSPLEAAAPPDLDTPDHGPALRAWLAAHPVDGPATLDRSRLDFLTDDRLSTRESVCARIDEVWRCTTDGWLESWGSLAQLGALLGGDGDVMLPVETVGCDGGAEESACIHRLHLLRMDGATLVDEGSFVVAVRNEEIDRAEDYYEDAPSDVAQDKPDWGTYTGVMDEFRWTYAVEASRCVRMISVGAKQTRYVHVYRWGAPPRERSRTKPRRVVYAPAPNEIPAGPRAGDSVVWSVIELVNAPIVDLRGRWRLDGGRWIPVDHCS